MRLPCCILPLTALIWAAHPQLAASSAYSLLSDGLLCINSNFVRTFNDILTTTMCAYKCDEFQLCRAFTTADGPCQIFLFDKCSKSVKNCGCSRRGQVFVKQLSGVQPGALCPAGYEDDLCGVKYKMFATNELWGPSRTRCESQSGLVIMSDVMDETEMSQVDALYSKYNIGTFWLGGYQAPSSPEPAGGWYWVSCNIPIATGLWGGSDPDNGNSGRENAVGRWTNHAKLADFWESSPTPKGVLCECLSPFN